MNLNEEHPSNIKIADMGISGHIRVTVIWCCDTVINTTCYFHHNFGNHVLNKFSTLKVMLNNNWNNENLNTNVVQVSLCFITPNLQVFNDQRKYAILFLQNNHVKTLHLIMMNITLQFWV